MNKTQLALIVALSVISMPGLAAEINVGGGTITIDEGGVSIGKGVIEVTPDAIRVPGVVVKPGVESKTAAQPQGGSAPGQVFTGTDFSGANHSGRDYSGGRFIGVDFSDANLSNANFTGAEFQGVDFADANLTGAIFVNTRSQGFRRREPDPCQFHRGAFPGHRFHRFKPAGRLLPSRQSDCQ